MEVGRVLAERYELVERLGSGGMAEVFRAVDRVLDRDVAVKVLSPQRATDAAFVRRFEREARSAASLDHPNVVGVHDFGSDELEGGDTRPFIVMQLVEGPTLEQVIAEEGPLPLDRALEVGRQVCAALSAAHAAGLVHRDIKPSNIMFDRSGGVLVTDFGIALSATESTRTTSVYGSVSYLAPEQARGERVDGRADLYAFGCVLYAMLTGDPPYTGDEPIAVVLRHLDGDLEPPSTHRPDVPDQLDAIVLRALASDPDERYTDAESLRADLTAVAEGRTLGPRTAKLGVVPDAPTVRIGSARAAADRGGTGGGGEATDDAPGGRGEGRAPWWRNRAFAAVLLVTLGAALLAAVLAQGQDPTATGAATTPPPATTPSAIPSPAPPPTVEDAVLDLYQVVEEGRSNGEISGEAAQEITKVVDEAWKEHREGKSGKALEKLAEAREKVRERASDGAIEVERARLLLAAIDRVEQAFRSAPVQEDGRGGGNGGGDGRGNGGGDDGDEGD